jgi:hypothetical protein
VDPKDKEKVGISESPHSDSEKNEVTSWLRTIEATERWKDGIAQKGGWKRFIAEYRNSWDFLQASVTIPIIPINLVFAYCKTEIARLYFKDPWITVNPKRIEDIGASQIAEQIVNYTWGEIKLKQQFKQAILEALLVGHAWMKLGYAAEFGTVESQPKENPKGRGRPKAYKEVETNEYIKSENVFAYHVHWKDVLFDPSATYPATTNARWMVHKIVRPYRAVTQSGIYEHTDELKPMSGIDDPNVPYDTPASIMQGQGKDVKSVTLYEIYDLDHQVVTTVSPGCTKKLREIPLPDYLNGGFPFVQLAFNPVPGEVYPMSDIAPHEGQIIEMTKIFSLEMNHLKRWNRQLITDPDTFSEAEMSKFKDAIDGAIITGSQPGTKDRVFPAPYAPVQSDIYQIWNQAYDIWKAISGQTPQDQGGQARAQTRTLGELRMSQMGGHARSDEKLDVIEDFIEEVARKLLTIMQKKYDLTKISRIVGPKAVQEKILKVLSQRPSAQPTPPVAGTPPPVGQSLTPGQPGPSLPGLQMPPAAGLAGPPVTPPAQNPQSFQTDFSFSWNKEDILGEMDVDVVAGSTAPMDRESQLEVMEKMGPILQLAGITPGSPAAKEFAKEAVRLVGIMGLEMIIDLANQSPPQPNPKVMETQAKIQAKQVETTMKIKGKQQEEAIKLQAMKEKLAMDQQKNKIDLQKTLVHSILDTFRSKTNGMNGQNGDMQ